MPSSMTGLRERKKQQTRRLIAETARQLFSERGFEHVPVAEVARVADVAETTVFNYFPRKEDLVYWQLASFEEQLLATVRERAPGETVLSAFRRFLLAQRGLLGQSDPEARAQLAAIARMIVASPALLARERQIFDGFTDSLAALIAAEQDAGAVEPWVVANALMGVHRALIDYSRDLVIADTPNEQTASAVRAEADRAFTRLERGLAEYAPKPA
jgi:AcrR family transcriptional regulator